MSDQLQHHKMSPLTNKVWLLRRISVVNLLYLKKYNFLILSQSQWYSYNFGEE
jgi:hypothetical protein